MLIKKEFLKLKKTLCSGQDSRNMNKLALAVKGSVTSYKLDYFLFQFKKYELYEFFLTADNSILVSDTREKWVKKVKENLINEGYLYGCK